MFCNKCGANIDDDARFCDNCGAVTGNAAHAPHAPAAQPPQQQYHQPAYQQPHQPYPPADYGNTASGAKVNKNAFIAGIAVVAVAAIGLAFFFAFRGGGNPQQTPAPNDIPGQIAQGEGTPAPTPEQGASVPEQGAAVPDPGVPASAGSDDPLLYPDLSVVPPSILEDADRETYALYMETDASRTFSGYGVMTIDNPEAYASLVGFDSEAAAEYVEECRVWNGNKYASVASMNDNGYGWFDAWFTQGDMEGSGFFVMNINESSIIAGGVAQISDRDTWGDMVVDYVLTLVFLSDGSVFCQSHTVYTDGVSTCTVAVRHILTP